MIYKVCFNITEHISILTRPLCLIICVADKGAFMGRKLAAFMWTSCLNIPAFGSPAIPTINPAYRKSEQTRTNCP